MLKTILLDCSQSNNIQITTQLKNELPSGCSLFSLSDDVPLFTWFQQNEISPKDCILIANTPTTIREAKQLHLPTIGYQPPNSTTTLYDASIIIEEIKSLSFPFIEEEHLRANGLPVTIASTERLFLRELTCHEFEQLYHLCMLPENQIFLPAMNSLEEECAKHSAYIKNMYQFYRMGLWGVFLTSSGELIGRCGLQPKEIGETGEIELAYFITTKYQRQGYGSEAVATVLSLAKEEYELDSIVAAVDPSNKASIHLLNHFHFVKENKVSYEGHNCLLYRKQLLETN